MIFVSRAKTQSKPFKEPFSASLRLCARTEKHVCAITYHLTTTQILSSPTLNTCTLLIGDGGSGKTTTLRMVLGEVAQQLLTRIVPFLPVFVDLSRYSDDFSKLIHDSLGIRFGHWTSLPGNFLLLCDGLNEVPAPLQKNLLKDISTVIETYSVAIIITSRKGGLRRAQTLPNITQTYELLPLTRRQTIQISEHYLGLPQTRQFVDRFRKIQDIHQYSLFDLPFGLALSVAVFKERGDLPQTSKELIDIYLHRRFCRNQIIEGFAAGDLLEVNYESVRTLSELVAYRFRIEFPQKSFAHDDFQEFFPVCVTALKQRKLFEIAELSFTQVKNLLIHYEFIVPKEGKYYFEHDLIADHLASKDLASCWQDSLASLQSGICDDAWIFAATEIPEAEHVQFLKSIAEIDLLLAALCAGQIGEKGIAIVEPIVFTESEKDSIFAIEQSMQAMGILGSQNCIERLTNQLKTKGISYTKCEPPAHRGASSRQHIVEVSTVLTASTS